MTQHLHSEFVEGCYRCDLSRDELPGMRCKAHRSRRLHPDVEICGEWMHFTTRCEFDFKEDE